jgi:hypothetical protein
MSHDHALEKNVRREGFPNPFGTPEKKRRMKNAIKLTIQQLRNETP